MPYARRRGAQSANAGADPYAKNNFKGTVEIQEHQKAMVKNRVKLLMKDGKPRRIVDIMKEKEDNKTESQINQILDKREADNPESKEVQKELTAREEIQSNLETAFGLFGVRLEIAGFPLLHMYDIMKIYIEKGDSFSLRDVAKLKSVWEQEKQK